MPYCTHTDVEAVFDNAILAQLTTPTAASVNDAFIDATCVDVSAAMNAYFLGAYVVPITDATTLTVLKPWAVRLVIAELMGDRMLEQYPTYKERAKEATDWLKRVQAGTSALGPGCAKTTATADPVQVALEASSYPRQFGPDDPAANVLTVTIL